MKNNLSRRDFIKIAAGAALSLGFAPMVKDAIYQPYVMPPEEVLPGKPNWYSSTCRQCAAGCGILVKVVNGRAKKIEGNPYHPVNLGKLCARGQAGLQLLYHPDRLKNAVVQSGGRRSRVFSPIYWEEAIELLVGKLKNLQPSRIAFVTGQIPDHLHNLIRIWLQSMGASPPMMFDLQSSLEGRVVESEGMKELFSTNESPIYDIANADVIFSFGANFLETWQSPVAYGRAYGEFRQGRTGGRGYMVHFEPRLSATAAVADEWIPIKPGTDGLIALALGRIIVENNLGQVGFFTDQEAGFYQDVNVNEISTASDVPINELERLARIIASSKQPLAIPGGYPLGQKNGYFSFKSIQSINFILKRFGQPGGVYISPPLPESSMPKAPKPASIQSFMTLIENMKTGGIDLLFISGANPIFELPQELGFVDAISNVPYVVTFSPFIDETAVYADLILPDHSYLEGWGYQIPSPTTDRPSVSNQQPAVVPIYDTRSTGNVILDLARNMGESISSHLPWLDESLYLEDISGSLYGSSLTPYKVKSAGEFWAAWRQYGGWWPDRELRQEPEPIGFGNQPYIQENPSFDANSKDYPFHLYPYSSVGLSDGRGANLPWLQEIPDPMTTVSWRNWIEINAEICKEIGIENNDIVKVISPYGEVEAVVVVYPGIRPDVVAVPIGQGHQDYGRYAMNRGENPIKILALAVESSTGSFAWGATKVKVEPTGRKFTLARLESLDGEGRETIR